LVISPGKGGGSAAAGPRQALQCGCFESDGIGNTPVGLKNFVRQPEKTILTASVNAT
jgi:hypothetical protein